MNFCNTFNVINSTRHYQLHKTNTPYTYFFQCIPFWPISTEKKKRMMVRIGGDELETAPFCYVEPHTTLMRLDNDYAGINV